MILKTHNFPSALFYVFNRILRSRHGDHLHSINISSTDVQCEKKKHKQTKKKNFLINEVAN